MTRAGMIYKNQHTHAAPREVVVKSMGFAGINGASATAYSALLKFGLLERLGEDAKLSERAMRILHPNSSDERAVAIREAAFDPPLFQELAERFTGPLPAEEVLRNYLIRKGFAPGALPTVILAYRETMSLVEQEGGAYDSGQSLTLAEGHAPMLTTAAPTAQTQGLSQFMPPIQSDERPLGRHDFDDGSYVRIAVHGDLDTEEALSWVEILIENKRRELKTRSRRVPEVIPSSQTASSGSDE